VRAREPTAPVSGARASSWQAARLSLPWLASFAGPALLVLGAYALVLFAHGFVPGRVPDAPSAYLAEGSIRCLNDLGVGALTSWCHDFGEPLGHPVLTGGPSVVLGALLMYLPGVGSHTAYLVTGAIVDVLALAGGYGLMRRLGAGALVALGTATTYLISPTMLGLAGFGGTFYGFLLLPAYAYVDLVVIDAVTYRGGRVLALAFAGYATVKTGALFMDGYSFVAGNLVGAALWLVWLLQRGTPTRRRALGVAMFAGAGLVALATYTLYVPGSYDRNPIEVFRAFGLDLVTVVVPSVWVWPAAALKLGGFRDNLWGDSTSNAFNYAGLFSVGLAIVYLARAPRRRQAVALAAAGTVAFLLALGPSLRFHEVRHSQFPNTSYEAYLMPESETVTDLPWGRIHTSLPGLDYMRATFRWFGVTRLALIVLAGLAIARLAGAPGGRRWAAALLALVAVAEIFPNLPLYAGVQERNHRSLSQLSVAVEPDLRAATRPGERVFMLNYDGRHVDYLADYLAAGADLRAYNTGGDKNFLLSQKRWPPEVMALAKPIPTAEEVEAALRSGEVDVVLVPYFHLRFSAYVWPPAPEVRQQARASYAALLSDPRFAVLRRPWFATLRLKRPRT
jgi:hypothetical protein